MATLFKILDQQTLAVVGVVKLDCENMMHLDWFNHSRKLYDFFTCSKEEFMELANEHEVFKPYQPR